MWDLRTFIGLCDRRLTKDYREDAVRIFKDISIFTEEAKEGVKFKILNVANNYFPDEVFHLAYGQVRETLQKIQIKREI